MKTRVSVIIPIYNVYEFLEECLESVVNQTINDMELTDGYERNLQIILIDDGSTDSSPIIAKEYAENYENIEYHHEVNQGLGHARNYGCKFAEGDYIIFLDSDDKLSPNAYEWMYKTAIRNDSDMTIGGFWRFNSKKYKISNINKIAFNGNKEKTHIRESPELFYDTTAWNKLIKHSFWKKHNFQFPEGILYEDIPVTIPMHFLANNVSIVYENCYLWRIREGKSKSITQTTTEIKNLEDRLYVMGLVDKFFDENVDDERLHHVKTMKWLKTDLLIFIRKLRSMDKEQGYKIMSLIRDYIQNNIDTDEFKYLNEYERLKYEYLMNDEFDKIVSILNFKAENIKETKVYQKNGHIMFNADKEVFKQSPFYIDRYIREKYNRKYIQDIEIRDDGFLIRGFMLIPGLDIKNFKDREHRFHLTNANSHKKIRIESEDVETGNISSFNIRFGRGFSYDAAGYKIFIPFSKICDDEDFFGENRISVDFKLNGIYQSPFLSYEKKELCQNFFLGYAKKDIRQKTNMKAVIYKNTYFRIRYTLKDEIIIEALPLKNYFKEIRLDENVLKLDSDHIGNLFVYYEEYSINEEEKIAFEYDNEDKSYKMDIRKLKKKPGKILCDGENSIYKSKELILLDSKYGQCLISTLNDYYLDIYYFDNLTQVLDIKQNSDRIDIDARLYSNRFNETRSTYKADRIKTAKLYFKDDSSKENYILSDGMIDRQTGHIKFSIDFSNKEITKNLYEKIHDLYVEYAYDETSTEEAIVDEEGDKSENEPVPVEERNNKINKESRFSTELYLFKDDDKTISKSYYEYKVYHDLKGFLKLKVLKRWPIYENTPGKRLKHSQISYKLFSKLPINKKRIMFESIWGGKYSCNPRYLYEYIDENYPHYECIWSFKDEHYPIKGNGKRVRRSSLKYLYYLATSKYLINNVNFKKHFIKRKGQVEIQTMHGTPLKTIGLDAPGEFPTKKSQRDYIKKNKNWDYLTVQSDYVAEISRTCFKYEKDFLKFGYPRTDILYTKNNKEDIQSIKERMGLPSDKKVILYAPTWRFKNNFDLMLDLKSFKESLKDEYILILRLHHFSAGGWKQPLDDDFVYDFSGYGSIEELYLISDILITDYSSVMFDYAILDRPIILFAYDLEEYGEKLRGFYMDIESNKPGPILHSSKEVEEAILNIEKTEMKYKDLRRSFKERFNQYECENSSEKIFNKVIDKKKNKK